MVEVEPFLARCRPAHAAELAVHGDQVDQRLPGTQLVQPELLLA